MEVWGMGVWEYRVKLLTRYRTSDRQPSTVNHKGCLIKGINRPDQPQFHVKDSVKILNARNS